jgi:hypothetical protein
MASGVKQPGLRAALVLETNNLRGGGAEGAARGVASLERLLLHLGGQTRPLAALDEVVVTHDGIGAAEQRRLERAAGRALRFVAVSKACGYYEAKNLGFDATTSEIVAFGDADCWPEAAWLERLLAPFARAPEGPAVVAGRTTYRRDLLGVAASTIDFMYFPSPLGQGCTRNFYANNVAFEREVFAAHRYTSLDGVYRGDCQVLGLRLQARGVRIEFAPAARTIHRFPDGAREFLELRLLRGEDCAELTPHLAATYLPRPLTWLGCTGPLGPLAVLGVRLACSVASIGRQDMPAVAGWRYLACVGAIAGMTAADAVGAVARGARMSRGSAVAEARALSYHGDGDGLVAAG